MLLIPYTLQAGPFGLGLHTVNPLMAGEVVYRMVPALLLTLSDEAVRQWPQEVQERFRRHAYRGQGPDRLTDAFYYNADDSRFMNHAPTPSLRAIGQGQVYVAARDLPAGAELTCDYADFAQRGEACFNF